MLAGRFRTIVIPAQRQRFDLGHAARGLELMGGDADRFVSIGSVDQLKRALEIDPQLRILGDGANLLVDDDGVGELVVKMDGEGGGGELCGVAIDHEHCRVTAGAGVNLPKLINETVRLGFAGLEGLSGIPATVGGAAVMNAGGSSWRSPHAPPRCHSRPRRARSWSR